MVRQPISRRDALRLSGLAAIGLAGCAADADAEERSTPTATVATHENTVADPESATVRNPDGEPAVRSTVESARENLFEDEASWAYEDWLVRNANERDALWFADGTSDADDVTAFAAETDLSEATLLVHQFNIAACERRVLEVLEWSTGRSCGDATCTHIDLTYDSTVDESGCEGDGAGGPPFPEETRHNAATLVRIPAQVESYGSLGSQW